MDAAWLTMSAAVVYQISNVLLCIMLGNYVALMFMLLKFKRSVHKNTLCTPQILNIHMLHAHKMR